MAFEMASRGKGCLPPSACLYRRRRYIMRSAASLRVMAEEYKLDKWVWTEADFEQMGWHDAHIYAFAFVPEEFEFVLDIDYILEWVHPAPGETYFKFWVAPATLVFENVNELLIDLEPHSGIEIQDLKREDAQLPRNAEYINRNTEWRWVLDCLAGEISLRSIGYKQYFRRAPVFGTAQMLGLEGRGGFSFHRGLLGV